MENFAICKVWTFLKQIPWKQGRIMKRAHFVFLTKLDFRVGFKSQMMFVTKMRLLLSKACSLFCFLFYFQSNIFSF